MNAKEARDLLILESAGAARDRKEIQANAMAIMVLDKQIPKKPERNTIGAPQWDCPACGCRIVGVGAWAHKPFCCFCGQAIDWEDKE